VKLSAASPKEIALGVAVGAVGAAIFLFAFPAGSISTLVHNVFRLPGPGAGIALVFGPFLVFVVLVSSLLTRANGQALITASAFAISCTLLVCAFRARTDPKGVFGSVLFLAAVALLGLAVEVVLVVGKAFSRLAHCLLAGGLANAVLLVFYWLAIFPRTASGVKGKDIPLLMGICLVCGLWAAYLAWLVSRPLCRALALKLKE